MKFKEYKNALLYAKIETCKTGVLHKVVKIFYYKNLIKTISYTIIIN